MGEAQSDLAFQTKSVMTMNEASQALLPFEPSPGAVYSIDTVADLVSVSRRTILHYCQYGLIEPALDPDEEGYVFDDDAIRLLRQIDQLRVLCGDNLTGVQTIIELRKQVEELEAEVRFLRG